MPPKKDAVVEKVLLGRPGNNLKMGIVGLPNVGKSSIFNALTNSTVASENYPFCTIDPSEARVAVPDPRFDWLCESYKPASKVPAFLTVIDIAGLVKGAAEGQGLGNAFLSHIKAVDGIFHLVRCFDDEEVVHVEGEVNPVRDLEIIHNELRLKDAEFLAKQLETKKRGITSVGASSSAAERAKKEEYEIMQKVHDWVAVEKKDVRQGNWSNKEVEIINTFLLITAKPVVYLLNLSVKDFCRAKNKWLPKIKAWIETNNPGDVAIPYSGLLEQELSLRQGPEDKNAYLKQLEQTWEVPQGRSLASSMPKIIVTGYQALNLIYFFTAGPDEVRAWTLRKGSKAPQAAGVIHTDFEKGFVCAEVMKYEDLKELGTDSAVKAAGKYIQKGREYIVDDGDIIYFKAGQIKKK